VAALVKRARHFATIIFMEAFGEVVLFMLISAENRQGL